MLKKYHKLITNTFGAVKSSIILKPIVIKPGIVYKVRYALTLITVYFTIYYILSLIFIDTIKKKLLNLLILPLYIILFYIVTFLYKKVQRGPYHYKKYFVLSVISHIYLPLAHLLFLSNNFFVYSLGFSLNLFFSCLISYINMTFLTFWEGSTLMKGYVTILVNNLFINSMILLITKLLKLRK